MLEAGKHNTKVDGAIAARRGFGGNNLSANRIRDAYPAIGFTECRPGEVIAMMRWCPKRVNWSFEPYGIAIARSAAEKMGARPVIYGTDSDYKGLTESAKPFFQSRGGDDVDWRREREWRHIGDLDLSQLPDKQIMFIVWRQSEAAILSTMTSSPVTALTKD